MLRGRRTTVVVTAAARACLLAALGSLAIGVSASAQESAVVFDDTPGFGTPGPAHSVPFPLGGGVDYRIDYCPSCTEAELPGGSHGQLVGRGLFQSLLRIDVGESDAATFAVSEPATPVDSIFARVTGADPSEIFGWLRSEVEDADLYLLNPYGVIFGSTAQLDIGGSFYVSTADVLNFANGEQFEAWPGGAVPMEVAAPISFGFLVDAEPPATIRFEGPQRLSAADGETLSAVAGRVEIEGTLGVTDPTLESTGGQIQLAAVPSGTEVPLDVASLDVDSLGSDEAAVQLTSNAILEVSGSGPAGPARIVIRGGRFETVQPPGFAKSSTLRALETGTGAAPAIDIEVAGTLSLDAAEIESLTTAIAASGDIRLVGDRVELDDGTTVWGRIDDATLSPLGGPGIRVEANAVEIKEGSKLRTQDDVGFGFSYGQVVDIHVVANEVEVSGAGSEISTQSDGTGNGATLRVEAAQRLALANGGKILASRGRSLLPIGSPTDSGRIEVFAGELSVSDGAEIVSATSTNIAGAEVRIGTVESPIGKLEVRGGGIGSLTTASGAGGDVELHAQEIVVESSLAMPEANPQISALTTRAEDGGGGDGPGGNLTIYAGSIHLKDGGQLRATTEASAPAGNLEVHVAETLLAEGRNTAGGGEPRPSGIFARSATSQSHPGLPTTGAGGRLEITAKDIVMRAGAEFSARAQSEGPAGDLDIRAETILVEGSPDAESTISARGFIGPGGDLTIETDVLQLRNRGVVSVDTSGTGRSGDLEITAREIDIAGENTGVFAQSNLEFVGAGRAGNVTLAPPEGERLSLRIRDGATLSVRSKQSAAGTIEISGADLVEVSNGGEISARVQSVTLQPGEDPADLASDIRILDTDTLRVSDGTITAETGGNGFGGSIEIQARNVDLSGAEITTRSFAANGGDAGDIVIAAVGTFQAVDSTVTTSAADAGGGRISIQGGDLGYLLDSRLETTVQGEDAGEDAGDIDIPLRGDEVDGLAPVLPDFVVINRSIIRANATATNAGNITIAGNDVLISSDSLIEATSETGISGEIRISSPDADVVSQVTPLPSNFVDASDRLLTPCIARTERTGSFVVQNREALPPPPDAPLSPALAGASPSIDSEKCSVSEECS
ncbi:MAG: filamentous hemagglutinin N-terminal domain-containing protein [Deltaproteobacteria bacterium]|nr:filamentous hemagglutinin N-terminal domain-containing protein [Deltaproteobacteria bacterium]